MSSCLSDLEFAPSRSDKRIQNASKVLGMNVVNKLLAFALFLMGAKREDIANRLSIPIGTLFSLLRRIGKEGLPAIEDRRRKHADFLPPKTPESAAARVVQQASDIVLNFGNGRPVVRIPSVNSFQLKVFLLTLIQNELLSSVTVAKLLGYSPAHVARLSRQLQDHDAQVLLDKREGQKTDYRITPDIKAELIQQFVVDVIVHGKTSGRAISNELGQRCSITIPERTVRQHMTSLGLPKIKNSLPELVATVKKNFRTCS